MIFISAFGFTPSLGGSSMIRSGTSPSSSMTFNTSPAQNVQLSRLFNFAFSFAASTASSTISTPTTFFATGARICAIVPVPLYRSKTTFSFVSPMYSLAVSYRTSAPSELVWKNENGVILNFNPSNSS